LQAPTGTSNVTTAGAIVSAAAPERGVESLRDLHTVKDPSKARHGGESGLLRVQRESWWRYRQKESLLA
jgi:hypothetical protein